MKSVVCAGIVTLVLAGCATAPAAIVTTTYEFIPDQSTLYVSGMGGGGPYSIEGQFQLTVDLGAELASFEQIDATILGQGFLNRQSLGDLFHMTELESTYVSDAQIDFLLERNIPTFPSADIHLGVTFMDDSVHLTGRFSDPLVDGHGYSMDAVAVAMTYYVDAVDGDDDNDGLSPETAFATIQKGINTAEDGSEVLVYPSVYTEAIDFLGKAITVKSAKDAAVLEPQDYFAVLFHSGEDHNSVLKNFVVRNSFIAILLEGSSPTISNVTVADNAFGIAAYAGAEPDISNSIFWNNIYGDLFGCQARYSCIQEAGEGQGNLDIDPLFADPENGDYHLLSRRGRYWPEHNVWVLDDVISPCIDGGDPNADYFNEPKLNGGRVNMGAYGGTAYASMKEMRWVHSDINHDGWVNMIDFAVLAKNWLKYEPGTSNLPPEVSIIMPQDGDRFECEETCEETIEIEANAWDIDGSIVKVEFFADGSKIGEDNDGADGWKTYWQNYTPSVHYLTAKATDDDGATATSTAVQIRIIPIW